MYLEMGRRDDYLLRLDPVSPHVPLHLFTNIQITQRHDSAHNAEVPFAVDDDTRSTR